MKSHLTQPNLKKELKTRIVGHVSVEEMPFDLHSEIVRSSLQIAPHTWNSYSNEIKGKTIAVYNIQRQLEKLERFYQEIERAEKNK